MGMSANFKKCMFGGFDPEDVIAYIDRTTKEYQEKLTALTEDNQSLSQSNQEMQGELNMIRQQFVDQEKSSRETEELREQLTAATQKLQQLEEEASALRVQTQDYQTLKDHIADIEINAHRRTEEFRAAAVAQMQDIVNKQRTWCDEMKTKYRSISEQFAQKLQLAQQTLENPDMSGFTEMEESLKNLEDSFSD